MLLSLLLTRNVFLSRCPLERGVQPQDSEFCGECRGDDSVNGQTVMHKDHAYVGEDTV